MSTTKFDITDEFLNVLFGTLVMVCGPELVAPNEKYADDQFDWIDEFQLKLMEVMGGDKWNEAISKVCTALGLSKAWEWYKALTDVTARTEFDCDVVNKLTNYVGTKLEGKVAKTTDWFDRHPLPANFVRVFLGKLVELYGIEILMGDKDSELSLADQIKANLVYESTTQGWGYALERAGVETNYENFAGYLKDLSDKQSEYIANFVISAVYDYLVDPTWEPLTPATEDEGGESDAAASEVTE